jgi:hypothetical protein
MTNKTNVNLIESFFQLVNTGNLDVKMNYIPRLLDQLEIFVTDKESKDKEFIQGVRANIVHAFNAVAELSPKIGEPKVVRKLVELFSQNALLLDESYNTERAVFGTSVALELYSLADARMKYRRAIGQYGLFLNGQRDGYINAVDLSDQAIYNITKICMDNNLVSSADTWTFPSAKEETK